MVNCFLLIIALSTSYCMGFTDCNTTDEKNYDYDRHYFTTELIRDFQPSIYKTQPAYELYRQCLPQCKRYYTKEARLACKKRCLAQFAITYINCLN